MSQIFPPISGTILQGPVLEAFAPQHRLISDVSTARNAVVTTSANHGYYDGMTVRISVPKVYGMVLYEQTQITVTGDTTFVTQIDTTNVDAFVVPVLAVAFTPAQTTPVTGIERNIS